MKKEDLTHKTLHVKKNTSQVHGKGASLNEINGEVNMKTITSFLSLK